MNITLVNRFLDDTAFILESRGGLLLQLIFDTQMAESPRIKEIREACKPTVSVVDGIAHVPIQGVLAYNPAPFEILYGGFEDSRNVLAMVNATKDDPKVKAVQYNVDSPGGMMTGGFEIGDAIAACQKVKPTVAHIGGTGASLAYMIASQAGEVIANRTARVGSLGAFTVHIDKSIMAHQAGIKVEVIKNKEAKYKAIGQPGTSLTDEQRAYLTNQAQANFDEFKGMILSARPGVAADAMQGQVFTGQQAKANGLVDRIGDSAFATSCLKSRIKT